MARSVRRSRRVPENVSSSQSGRKEIRTSSSLLPRPWIPDYARIQTALVQRHALLVGQQAHAAIKLAVLVDDVVIASIHTISSPVK